MTDYKRRTFSEWLINAPRVPVNQERSETPSPAIIPPSLQSRPAATVADSLSISAVYAAVRILTNWTAQMPLGVYKNGEELPAPSLIAQPDPETSQFDFIRRSVVSAAIADNVYYKVTRRQSDGAPLSLEVLNPFAMEVVLNDAGKKLFRYTGYKQVKEYTSRDIVHIVGFPMPGRATGLSVLEAGGKSISGYLAMRQYADELFSGNGTGRTIYKRASGVPFGDDIERQEWEDRVKAQKERNNGDIYGDVDSESINTPNDDVLFSQQQFSVTDVARWFGIPAGLLLADSGATGLTYQNLSIDSRLFVTNTLMGYMRPIEEALTGLLPRGQVVRFNTEALLRSDTQERYESYRTAIEAGFMTVNEVRAKEGLPPIQEKETPPEPTEEA